MIRFFASWREKRKSKRAFVRDLNELVVLNFFGELEGDYETKVRELESSYLKRGLTRRELEKIRKNLGPVRISG